MKNLITELRRLRIEFESNPELFFNISINPVTSNDKMTSRTNDLLGEILTKKDVDALLSSPNYYSYCIDLRSIIGKKFHNVFNNELLNRWIIGTWGGMVINNSTLGKTSGFGLNLQRFTNDSAISLENQYSRPIVSLSKIASFIDPNNFFVCDNKTSFSLNALIHQYCSAEGKHFFTMLEPKRGAEDHKKLGAYLKKTYNKNQFYMPKESYFRYCELLKDLYRSVFDDDIKNNTVHYPKMEILLFSIAYQEAKKWFKNDFNVTN